MHLRLGFRSLAAFTRPGNGLGFQTRAITNRVGVADPKIHADDPQEEEAEEKVKGDEARLQQQEELIRSGGLRESEPPSTTNRKKSFASSLKLESSELGGPLDPSSQQKRGP